MRGRVPQPRVTPEPSPVEGARWIPLTRGLFALVDESDYAWASRFTWHASLVGNRIYAVRSNHDGRPRNVLMHRQVLNAPIGQEIDHIDIAPMALPGLDNRRINLRLATTAQNQCNRRAPRNNTSGFKGVHFAASVGRWQARIAWRRHRTVLGYFGTAEEAARAYDVAAARLHGTFAKLNFTEAANV